MKSKLLKLHSKTAVEEGFDLFSFIHKTQIFWINEFGEGRGGGGVDLLIPILISTCILNVYPPLPPFPSERGTCLPTTPLLCALIKPVVEHPYFAVFCSIHDFLNLQQTSSKKNKIYSEMHCNKAIIFFPHRRFTTV